MQPNGKGKEWGTRQSTFLPLQSWSQLWCSKTKPVSDPRTFPITLYGERKNYSNTNVSNKQKKIDDTLAPANSEVYI